MPKRPTPSLLIVCALVTNLALSAVNAEPVFEGKAFSLWLKLYQDAKPDSPEETQAKEAIRAIGTNAVPQLIQMLTTNDFNSQGAAENGFEILGPLGAPAIPTLTNLLHNTNTVISFLAASCLAHIGVPALPALMNALTDRSYRIATDAALAIVDLGTNATPAIPVFLHDLSSQNHFVRERAADALGKLHLQPELVFPALANTLHDGSQAARFLALRSLGQFQEAAEPAIPAILPLLQDTNEDTRVSASNMLHDIAPERFKAHPPLPRPVDL